MKRCDDMFNRHHCPVCGNCSCRTEARPHVWLEWGSDPSCPMHGVDSPHGQLFRAGRFRVRIS